MEVSSSTVLFCDIPQEPIDKPNPYKDICNKKFVISVRKPVEPTKNNETPKQNETENPQQQTKERQPEHKAILKGTHGHKLFAMLNNLKMTQKTPQPDIENIDTKSVVTKRKLTMSK